MNLTKPFSVVAVAFSAALLAGCASVTTPVVPPQQAEKFQAAIDNARTEGAFPGAIASVTSPQGSWIGSSGTAKENTDSPPKPSEQTRIGSITKTMTTTILLQLMEEQKLSLSDTIDKYVPGMPNGSTATLLQLANMTSGIPTYSAEKGFAARLVAHTDATWTPQQLIDLVRAEPADFPAGTKFEYSNTNTVLLGLVIEQVTQKPIADVFRERLFGPLKMNDSFFPDSTPAFTREHFDGVTNLEQPAGTTVDATSWNPSSSFTAGEVVSTLDDLQKWAHALFTGEGILKPETQQMRRDSIVRDIPPNTATAGYGIGIGDRNGWWGHDGQVPGYTTTIFHNYETDTTIITITNSDVSFEVDGKETVPATAVFSGLRAAIA